MTAICAVGQRIAHKLRAAVNNGALFFDAVMPGWARKINLDTFDMVDPCRCIGGQLYGDFKAAVIANNLTKEMQLDLGLNLERFACIFSWRILKDAWVEEVQKRLVADHGAPPAPEERVEECESDLVFA